MLLFLTFFSVNIGIAPVLYFGSKELKDRICPPCFKGEKVICLCITEPYAGSDVANIKATAKKSPCGKYYTVNGEKKWITNGTYADYFTVRFVFGKKFTIFFLHNFFFS